MPTIRDHATRERRAAHAAFALGHTEQGWTHLERAHIYSQPDAWLHLVSHWEMLVRALREWDAYEVLGQVARLVLAAPGSWSGRYPRGNTGRARVKMFAPMPIPDELHRDLTDAHETPP